jgi:hypothetical protein
MAISRAKKRTKRALNNYLEGTEEKAITYECPVRGTVTQIVEVKKFKSNYNPNGNLGVRFSDELAQIEEDFGIDEELEEDEDSTTTIN